MPARSRSAACPTAVTASSMWRSCTDGSNPHTAGMTGPARTLGSGSWVPGPAKSARRRIDALRLGLVVASVRTYPSASTSSAARSPARLEMFGLGMQTRRPAGDRVHPGRGGHHDTPHRRRPASGGGRQTHRRDHVLPSRVAVDTGPGPWPLGVNDRVDRPTLEQVGDPVVFAGQTDHLHTSDRWGVGAGHPDHDIDIVAGRDLLGDQAAEPVADTGDEHPSAGHRCRRCARPATISSTASWIRPRICAAASVTRSVGYCSRPGGSSNTTGSSTRAVIADGS